MRSKVVPIRKLVMARKVQIETGHAQEYHRSDPGQEKDVSVHPVNVIHSRFEHRTLENVRAIPDGRIQTRCSDSANRQQDEADKESLGVSRIGREDSGMLARMG